MRKICAKCGRVEQQAEFVGAFCPSCAPALYSASLPSRIAVDKCPRCGRIRRGNEFLEASREELTAAVTTRLRGSAEVAECRLKTETETKAVVPAELDCTFSQDGKEFRKTFSFEFAFEPRLCGACRKISSGYHEAILQLRGEAGRVERAAERFRRALGDEITKEKCGKNGVDLLIAERDAMMKLVMSLHKPYTATRKLKGVKRGRHQFVTTVCIRL